LFYLKRWPGLAPSALWSRAMSWIRDGSSTTAG